MSSAKKRRIVPKDKSSTGISCESVERVCLTYPLTQQIMLGELRSGFNCNKRELASYIGTLTKNLSIENASIILGFLTVYYNKRSSKHSVPSKLVIPKLEHLLLKLKKFLPITLYPYLETFRRNIFSEENLQDEQNINMEETKDIFERFRKIVTDVLIRKSSVEIKSAVNREFLQTDHISENKKLNFQTLMRYYHNISKEKKGFGAKIISTLVTEEDAQDILLGCTEYPEDSEILLLAIFIYNRDVYDCITDLIYTEKRFFKESIIKAVPFLDEKQIIQNIKDYTWGVLESLLVRKPGIAKEVIMSFHAGQIGMSRKFFVEKIRELDWIFAKYLDILNFTQEETIELCSKSTIFSEKYFDTIKTEDTMYEFCKVFSKYPEDYVLGFIKESQKKSNFLLFIKALANTMRFTGAIKDYVTEVLIYKKDTFHILITYIDDINVIESLLNKFYEPNTSLESLLRKFHYPQELLITIYKFHNQDITKALVEEASASKKFTDNDWLFLIKSLNAYPLNIQLQTILSLLKNRSSFYKMEIKYLHEIISKYTFVHNAAEDLVEKIISFCHDDDIMYIFSSCKKPQLKAIVDNSSAIKKKLKDRFNMESSSLKASFKKILEEVL